MQVKAYTSEGGSRRPKTKGPILPGMIHRSRSFDDSKRQPGEAEAEDETVEGADIDNATKAIVDDEAVVLPVRVPSDLGGGADAVVPA